MNGQIRDIEGFIPAPSSWKPQTCQWRCIKAQSMTIPLVRQRKWACFTRLVSVASSAFTTDSVREKRKALIVSLYLTQWVLNGLKPINQGSDKRHRCWLSDRLPQKTGTISRTVTAHKLIFWCSAKDEAVSFKSCGFSSWHFLMTRALKLHRDETSVDNLSLSAWMNENVTFSDAVLEKAQVKCLKEGLGLRTENLSLHSEILWVACLYKNKATCPQVLRSQNCIFHAQLVLTHPRESQEFCTI